MAGSLNRCEFIGNLGADVEVRTMQNGDAVANFRIAVTDTWRDRDSGEKRERTEWIPVVIFNKGLVGVAQNYLRKGSKVFVSGRWQSRKWEDQNGQEKWTTELVLQNFGGELVLLDGKPRDGGNTDTAPSGGGGANLDDEVPFAPEWRA